MRGWTSWSLSTGMTKERGNKRRACGVCGSWWVAGSESQGQLKDKDGWAGMGVFLWFGAVGALLAACGTCRMVPVGGAGCGMRLAAFVPLRLLRSLPSGSCGLHLLPLILSHSCVCSTKGQLS